MVSNQIKSAKFDLDHDFKSSSQIKSSNTLTFAETLIKYRRLGLYYSCWQGLKDLGFEDKDKDLKSKDKDMDKDL